jgi:ATP dependent DNA ligase domain
MSHASGLGIETFLDWRPQRFGRRNVRKIANPLIEPLWDGVRCLVLVQAGSEPSIRDEDGESLAEDEELVPEIAAISTSLSEIVSADSALLDGYLTAQPTRSGAGLTIDPPQIMSAAELAGQFFVGGLANSSARRQYEESRAIETTARGSQDSPLAFAAIDLLMLDGDPILDAPLLERKRLLASVISETRLVRLTPYVRPPVDSWIISWRSAGFRALAYKDANSRYQPGEQSDDWATVRMPLN